MIPTRGRARRLFDWLQPLLLIPAVYALDRLVFRGEVSLAELRPGQHVEVAYQIRGCFAAHRARIVLHPRVGGGLRYSTTTTRGRHHSGVLSRGEAARLDRRVEIFREGRRGCTTSQAATLTLYEHGKPVHREALRDAWCSIGEDESALSFAALLPVR